MSWADDNGISEFDIDLDNEIEKAIEEREAMWKRGIHETRDGEVLKIKDMTDDHLKNTIRFFSNLDTSPLEKELAKRLK